MDDSGINPIRSFGEGPQLPSQEISPPAKAWTARQLRSLDLAHAPEIVKKVDGLRNLAFLDLAQPKSTISGPKDYGSVTLLVGTSTAGKTSTISALKNLEGSFFETGIDLAFTSHLATHLKTKFPQEYEFLTKCFHGENPDQVQYNLCEAIVSKKYRWKEGLEEDTKNSVKEMVNEVRAKDEEWYEGLTEKERVAFHESMEVNMWRSGLEAAVRGESALFDIIKMDRIGIREICKYPESTVRVALIYCPFSQLAERMAIRNREAEASGDIGNKREGVFPFEQFADLYGPVAPDEEPLEVIERDFAIKTFDENYQLPFSPEEKMAKTDRELAKKREADLKNFLRDLGFTGEVRQIKIAPKFKGYDVILNTGELSSDQCAQKILRNRRH